MFKFIEEVFIGEGVLTIASRLFNFYVPTYVFVIILLVIIVRRARSYIAETYPENSFLYKHFVTRLAPKVIGIVLGIISGSLFAYFKVPDWIQFSFLATLLLTVLMSKVKKIDNSRFNWPWEKRGY